MFDVLLRLFRILFHFVIPSIGFVKRTPVFEVYHSQTIEIGGKQGLNLFFYLFGNKRELILVVVVVVAMSPT